MAWHPRGRDVAQLGDVVDSVERLVELLGWTEEMRDLVRRETGKVQTLRRTIQGAALLTALGCGPSCMEPHWLTR